jgi:hypothetical protein
MKFRKIEGKGVYNFLLVPQNAQDLQDSYSSMPDIPVVHFTRNPSPYFLPSLMFLSDLYIPPL